LSNINIRVSTINDAETIIRFQNEMAMETEKKTLNEELIKPGVKSVLTSGNKGFYLVAEVDKSIVGSLLITYEWSDWRNAWYWWIQSVYVEKNWRRKGVYSLLHNEVISRCKKSKESCGVRLYVDKENKIAQKVYRELGMFENNYLLYETNFQY